MPQCPEPECAGRLTFIADASATDFGFDLCSADADHQFPRDEPPGPIPRPRMMTDR
ncbi:hypothetical protein [Agromyces badenianii]|uniref:hypothetical protein n=1 Tax=Agromyces badenianii TaxID=2080742 RepID=UPI00140473BA|nr:hypothetical protein [Agromyces badenianii]